MKITKREIIASIAIVAVMLVLGFVIGDKIQDRQNDKNAEYQKAVHIEDIELFQYGMNTNVGNAFVYGDLEAVDTVTFNEIGGEYLYIKKEEEHYNMHTRTVTHTRSNGSTYTTTEIYYTWDYERSWNKHSEKISFCGVEFDYGKIQRPDSSYIDTIYKSPSVRFIYRGVAPKCTGTIYTKLADNTILDNSRFFVNYTIDQALEYCTSNVMIVVFWVFWIVLSGAIIYGFYYLDNKWLE